jgi:hypothetical protein
MFAPQVWAVIVGTAVVFIAKVLRHRKSDVCFAPATTVMSRRLAECWCW